MCLQNSFPIKTPMLEYFDQIYVINLESRKDRLQEIREEFNKIGIDFSHPKFQVFKAIKPETYDGWPTQGTKGCYLSHLGVLKNAKQNGFERILILEDDASFTQYFNILMDETIRQLKDTHTENSAWGIFYGGYRACENVDDKITEAYKLNKLYSKNIFKPLPEHEIFCLHFVAITKPVIAQLVDYLEAIMNKPMGDPTGGRMHVDGAYNWFRKEHPEITTLMAYPQLAKQRSSRTDIHELKWFDVLPFFKTAAGAARKIKNHLI